MQYAARQHLEAFSIQLVCLALWKEALSLQQRDGSLKTISEADHKLFLPFLVESDDGGTEAVHSSVRYHFPLAVERAEEFAPLLYSLDGMSTLQHLFISSNSRFHGSLIFLCNCR